MKFLKKRSNLVVMGIVLVVVMGGALYFAQARSADATAAPALQTAKVRTGDLVITASGAGTIVAAAQVDLGFRSAGVVAEVNVTLKQQVKAGDVLARLDDFTEQTAFSQAEANLNGLFSPAGIAEYQIDMANAQEAYDTAVSNLQYTISPNVYYWEIKVSEAQQARDDLKTDANATDAAIADAQKAVERAEYYLKAAQAIYVSQYVHTAFTYYWDEDTNTYKWIDPETLSWDEETNTYTWIDEETSDEMPEIIIISPSPTDITLARATYEQTKLALADTQAALEIVQNGDRAALAQSLTAADGTALAKIQAAYLAYENSRLALENTRLIAPFDGSVVALDVVKGQTVGTSPVMTIATTNNLLARIYLDETDLDKLGIGKRVTITFDAYPDTPVEGEIVLVEPVIQTVDGSPVVAAWTSLPANPGFNILPGMSLAVEVIAGEARNALIVPKQALRELEPGVFAVFLVNADGQLVLTPVEVGLLDYANAEILSGLKVGDVVSTGNVETK